MKIKKMMSLLMSSLLILQVLLPVPIALAEEINSSANEESVEADLSYLAISYDGREEIIELDSGEELHLLGWTNDKKESVSIEVVKDENTDILMQDVPVDGDEVIMISNEIRLKFYVSDTFKVTHINPDVKRNSTILIEENDNGTMMEQNVIIDDSGLVLQKLNSFEYYAYVADKKVSITEEEYLEWDNENQVEKQNPVEVINDDITFESEELAITEISEENTVEIQNDKTESPLNVVSNNLSARNIDGSSDIELSLKTQGEEWKKTDRYGFSDGYRETPLEAIKITTNIEGLDINYSTQVQSYGWMPESSNGELNGTVGENKRIEAIKISLSGPEAENYSIFYTVELQSNYVNWGSNGEPVGTEGFSIGVTNITISITSKYGSVGYGDPTLAYVSSNFPLKYKTHVQSEGWQDYVRSGEMSGTSGKALRLEGIQINVDDPNISGGVKYRTHVQTEGWQNWKYDNEISGTQGLARRLEAIQIELTGDISDYYDIYYRVHVEKYGWLNWAKNGEKAGSEGYGFRAEAIEIKLVPQNWYPELSDGDSYKIKDKSSVVYSTHIEKLGWLGNSKDGKPSGTTNRALRMEALKINIENDQYSGGVRYRTHVQSNGWMKPVSNGKISGTSGQRKRVEAIEIMLTGEMAEHYDIYYRVYSQTYGWLGWAKNGMRAGTEGMSKRLENIEIKLVEKVVGGPKTDPYKAFRVKGFNYVRFGLETLKLVNDLRVSVGVPKLEYAYEFQEGSEIRIKDIESGYFSHRRPDGTRFDTVFDFEGIENWLQGENIAGNWVITEAGKEKEAAEIFFWQFSWSQGHYENMIDPSYTHFTTAVSRDGRYNVQILSLKYNDWF